MSRTVKLAIEGMHCGGCVTRLANTLKKLEGLEVRAVEVGSAEVCYDEARVTKEAIEKAVEGIGFVVAGERE